MHYGKQFQCNQCKKLLASKFSLKRHNLDVHGCESLEENGELVYKEVIEGTTLTEKQQNEIMKKQNLTIEALKKELKSAKNELKLLRAEVLAKQASK